MSYVPEAIRRQTPYAPNAGDYTIRLDSNESPFSAPPEVLDAFFAALRAADLNRYPDPAAADLCRAFGARYRIDPAFVVAGDGSDELISLIVQNLVGRSGGLALLEPDFSMYRFYAELAGVRIAACPRGGADPLGRLAALVREQNCTAVLFSNPCNPTGAGFSRAEILRFVADCPALCILDEAYMDFWDQSVLDAAAGETYENLIVLRTLSKAFGAAALRLGFAVSNSEITRALRVVKSPYNVGTLPQLLGKILLEQGRQEGAFLAAQARKLAAALQALLPDAEFSDTRANFVYLETPRAGEIFDFLAAAGIAVRKFDGALRITASTDQEQSALLCAVKNWKESRL